MSFYFLSEGQLTTHIGTDEWIDIQTDMDRYLWIYTYIYIYIYKGRYGRHKLRPRRPRPLVGGVGADRAAFAWCTADSSRSPT